MNVKTNLVKKHIFFAITLIVMVVFPACAQQQYNDEKEFQAKPIDGGKGVEITKYIGDKFEVRIPPRIQNLPVTRIGDEAFWKKNIINITIPNSVTSIGERAFEYCENLTNVTIPNSVISIGNHAFHSCRSLSSINIPNRVTSIGKQAFINTNLTSVIIPNSVTSIGERIFGGCTKLTAINVDAGNNSYSAQDGVLYNKNKTTLIQYPAAKKDSTFTIPNSVTNIEDWAFDSCENLASITIPNSVTNIGSYAFCDCKSLTSVTIPNSVTNIEDRAFYDCYSLTSVTIPNSVTNIGSYAFCGCKSLTSVTIPNSVTDIEYLAFSYCESLTSVTFQGTIPSFCFDEEAFLLYVGSSNYLRNKFYATDNANGTPGTYKRQENSDIWTKQ